VPTGNRFDETPVLEMKAPDPCERWMLRSAEEIIERLLSISSRTTGKAARPSAPPAQGSTKDRYYTQARRAQVRRATKLDARIAVTIPDDVAHQTYVIYRLTRWGLTKRWLSRAGVKNPKPAEMNSWWGPIVLDGNVEQTGIESMRDVCPWNLDEARETDVCVNALPGHLSAAIEEEYLKSGDRELKSARLGIDPSTMRRRLSAAHVLLLDLFNASAASLPLQVNYRGPGRPAKEEGPVSELARHLAEAAQWCEADAPALRCREGLRRSGAKEQGGCGQSRARRARRRNGSAERAQQKNNFRQREAPRQTGRSHS
jgi:hypothetical protein